MGGATDMSKVPIRSMTGYGESAVPTELGELRVEVRTVNHKHLSVQLRGPVGTDRHQVEVEKVLRTRLSRGHVTIKAALDRSSGPDAGAVVPDLDRARGYVESLRAIQEELGLGGTIGIGDIIRFRDVFRDASEEGDGEFRLEPLVEAISVATDAVLAMREEEGRRLAEDLGERLDEMDRQLARIAELAPARLEAERDRLREAIRGLLEDEISPDEERIAREIAHLAERWDIHEELVRFDSHLAMFREVLEAGDSGGVGKRLGFIAQEFLREANTIGSKANDAEIVRSVVTLKEEIDRVREQVENVE